MAFHFHTSCHIRLPRYFNFARLKGNYSKRGTLSFLLFFLFFPPSLSSFLSLFLFFFRDVSTNVAYFEKRRVRVSARSSTLVDDETRLHTRNENPRSWRVERTPSSHGTPSSVDFLLFQAKFFYGSKKLCQVFRNIYVDPRRIQKGQNVVPRVGTGRVFFLSRLPTLVSGYILYFRKTASALLGHATCSWIYDCETWF